MSATVLHRKVSAEMNRGHAAAPELSETGVLILVCVFCSVAPQAILVSGGVSLLLTGSGAGPSSLVMDLLLVSITMLINTGSELLWREELRQGASLPTGTVPGLGGSLPRLEPRAGGLVGWTNGYVYCVYKYTGRENLFAILFILCGSWQQTLKFSLYFFFMKVFDQPWPLRAFYCRLVSGLGKYLFSKICPATG